MGAMLPHYFWEMQILCSANDSEAKRKRNLRQEGAHPDPEADPPMNDSTDLSVRRAWAEDEISQTFAYRDPPGYLVKQHTVK